MKKHILALAFTLMCAYLIAQTSVFKVTGNETTMYIGGTIHLLQKSDFPLPEEFNKAYDLSEIIVFETDISEMSNPEVAQEMMKKAMYSEGKTLKSELSNSAYKLLEKACEKNGVPITYLETFKPSMALITLQLLKLQKIGFIEEGIDSYFFKTAKLDKKETAFFESIDEQINIITSMGEGNEDEFIKYSVKELDKLEEYMESLKKAWRKGDGKSMSKDTEEMKQFPKLYNSLLLDRNTKWLKILTEMMKTKETEFILVGALHLYGEDGILKMLENKGYTVEQF